MSLSNLVNIKHITNNIDSNIANLVTVIIIGLTFLMLHIRLSC